MITCMTDAAPIVKPAVGRKRKLTPELIEKVRRLIPYGAPESTIAAACGVSIDAWCLWKRRAREGVGDELEIQFFRAIQEGLAEGELTHLNKILNGDSKDAQWLLTHSPHWRRNWSDNAAAQRAVQRQMDGVVAAIEAAQSLTTEQKHDLLLHMQARGLGSNLVPADGDGGDG